MKKRDTEIILQRIKTFYPKFFFTSQTVENWYMEIKEYDSPHLFIEALRDYANQNAEPPSVINLKTIVDRYNNQEISSYKTTCKFCGRILDNDKLEIHEDRCRSIKYMCSKYQEIYNKVLDKRILWELELDEFNKRYDELLKVVLSRVTNPDEKFALEMYFKTMEEA